MVIHWQGMCITQCSPMCYTLSLYSKMHHDALIAIEGNIKNEHCQARQTQPNSGGGGCRGPTKIRQRGSCNNFLLFTR